jgi:hypothetical protein
MVKKTRRAVRRAKRAGKSARRLSQTARENRAVLVSDAPLRDLLQRLLSWEDAHVSFDSVVKGVPVELRARQPEGLPYSLWQLLEHVRICQEDILDFCRNPAYREKKWPDDYWPASPGPPSEKAWDDSVRQYRKDLSDLKKMAVNKTLDLSARIPHGSGQTYLRELVLVADHTAYHVGQMVLVRRLLGIWK